MSHCAKRAEKHLSDAQALVNNAGGLRCGGGWTVPSVLEAQRREAQSAEDRRSRRARRQQVQDLVARVRLVAESGDDDEAALFTAPSTLAVHRDIPRSKLADTPRTHHPHDTVADTFSLTTPMQDEPLPGRPSVATTAGDAFSRDGPEEETQPFAVTVDLPDPAPAHAVRFSPRRVVAVHVGDDSPQRSARATPRTQRTPRSSRAMSVLSTTRPSMFRVPSKRFSNARRTGRHSKRRPTEEELHAQRVAEATAELGLRAQFPANQSDAAHTEILIEVSKHLRQNKGVRQRLELESVHHLVTAGVEVKRAFVHDELTAHTDDVRRVADNAVSVRAANRERDKDIDAVAGASPFQSTSFASGSAKLIPQTFLVEDPNTGEDADIDVTDGPLPLDVKTPLEAIAVHMANCEVKVKETVAAALRADHAADIVRCVFWFAYTAFFRPVPVVERQSAKLTVVAKLWAELTWGHGDVAEHLAAALSHAVCLLFPVTFPGSAHRLTWRFFARCGTLCLTLFSGTDVSVSHVQYLTEAHFSGHPSIELPIAPDDPAALQIDKKDATPDDDDDSAKPEEAPKPAPEAHTGLVLSAVDSAALDPAYARKMVVAAQLRMWSRGRTTRSRNAGRLLRTNDDPNSESAVPLHRRGAPRSPSPRYSERVRRLAVHFAIRGAQGLDVDQVVAQREDLHRRLHSGGTAYLIGAEQLAEQERVVAEAPTLFAQGYSQVTAEDLRTETREGGGGGAKPKGRRGRDGNVDAFFDLVKRLRTSSRDAEDVWHEQEANRDALMHSQPMTPEPEPEVDPEPEGPAPVPPLIKFMRHQRKSENDLHPFRSAASRRSRSATPGSRGSLDRTPGGVDAPIAIPRIRGALSAARGSVTFQDGSVNSATVLATSGSQQRQALETAALPMITSPAMSGADPKDVLRAEAVKIIRLDPGDPGDDIVDFMQDRVASGPAAVVGRDDSLVARDSQRPSEVPSKGTAHTPTSLRRKGEGPAPAESPFGVFKSSGVPPRTPLRTADKRRLSKAEEDAASSEASSSVSLRKMMPSPRGTATTPGPHQAVSVLIAQKRAQTPDAQLRLVAFPRRDDTKPPPPIRAVGRRGSGPAGRDVVLDRRHFVERTYGSSLEEMRRRVHAVSRPGSTHDTSDEASRLQVLVAPAGDPKASSVLKTPQFRTTIADAFDMSPLAQTMISKPPELQRRHVRLKRTHLTTPVSPQAHRRDMAYVLEDVKEGATAFREIVQAREAQMAETERITRHGVQRVKDDLKRLQGDRIRTAQFVNELVREAPPRRTPDAALPEHQKFCTGSQLAVVAKHSSDSLRKDIRNAELRFLPNGQLRKR